MVTATVEGMMTHTAGMTVVAVDKATGAEYGYRMGPGTRWTVVKAGEDAGTYATRQDALAALRALGDALTSGAA